jgi:hypothetical protein
MPQAQLLLTPVTVAAIKALVERGHGLRLSYDTLKLRKVNHDAYRLVIPHGFVCHFDTGYYKPSWLCRHLSVQGTEKWPSQAEVRKLMQLAGFKGDLAGVVSWADRSHPRHVVHVLEPLDGRWEALWSS